MKKFLQVNKSTKQLKLGWRQLLAVLILVVLLYVVLRKSGLLKKANSSYPETPKESASQPHALPVEKADDFPNVASDKRERVTLELGAPADTYASDSSFPEDYSYTLTNKAKEHKIMPGVTYKSGEGLTVKLDDEQESIQLKRDSTYHPKEYQLFWKKKY